MKVSYFNDTGREIDIHPGTFAHGCKTSKEPIKPLEERIFDLPEGINPWIKMWEYGGRLTIFVSGKKVNEENVSGSGRDTQNTFYESKKNVDKQRIVQEFSIAILAISTIVAILSVIAGNFFWESELLTYSFLTISVLGFLVGLIFCVKSFKIIYLETKKMKQLILKVKGMRS